MSDKIKCTYDECFKHFQTEAAMKKHKAKDDAHDYYCKRCDLDCIDDTELLYHQITDARHIACPVCGRDFKSEAGRDRHVEIEHVPKQKIDCAGCQMSFERAAALMNHIERDECEVIKARHFHQQRAEKQISKDAWHAALDPRAGSTILSGNTYQSSSQVEKTLLDDDKAWRPKDWQGIPQDFDPENEHHTRYTDSSMADGISTLSINQYPALAAQLSPRQPSNQNGFETPSNVGSNLLDIDQEPQIYHPRVQPNNVWSTSLPTRQQPQIQVNTAPPSTNLLDNFEENDSRASWQSRNEPTSNPTNHDNTIHRRTTPTTTPNFNPNTHITTVSQINMPSYIQIDRFWDAIQENYACPGQKCGARFNTIEDFKRHLLSGAHVGGTVTCPSCLKKFRTTAALVAHCESGSRRCKIKNALDYDLVIREVTAGIVATDGYLLDGSVKYTAPRIENW